jgi:hypothetical protein
MPETAIDRLNQLIGKLESAYSHRKYGNKADQQFDEAVLLKLRLIVTQFRREQHTREIDSLVPNSII